MRVLSLLSCVLACGLAQAQQSPALPRAPEAVSAPGVSTLRPEYAPPAAAPRTTAVVEGLERPNELRDLIRAQSEAIRQLTAKVDALQDQVRRIESRLR